MPEPTLQAAALRYAAGDLTATEAAAFEVRLADDQEARDALAEAVRLSAAALGQHPPTAHRSFRAAIREKLIGWNLPGFARRAYRGHPFAWAGLGAAAVAACTVIGLALAERDSAPAAVEASRTPVVVAQKPQQVIPSSAVAIAGSHDCDPVASRGLWRRTDRQLGRRNLGAPEYPRSGREAPRRRTPVARQAPRAGNPPRRAIGPPQPLIVMDNS